MHGSWPTLPFNATTRDQKCDFNAPFPVSLLPVKSRKWKMIYAPYTSVNCFKVIWSIFFAILIRSWRKQFSADFTGRRKRPKSPDSCSLRFSNSLRCTFVRILLLSPKLFFLHLICIKNAERNDGILWSLSVPHPKEESTLFGMGRPSLEDKSQVGTNHSNIIANCSYFAIQWWKKNNASS